MPPTILSRISYALKSRVASTQSSIRGRTLSRRYAANWSRDEQIGLDRAAGALVGQRRCLAKTSCHVAAAEYKLSPSERG